MKLKLQIFKWQLTSIANRFNLWVGWSSQTLSYYEKQQQQTKCNWHRLDWKESLAVKYKNFILLITKHDHIKCAYNSIVRVATLRGSHKRYDSFQNYQDFFLKKMENETEKRNYKSCLPPPTKAESRKQGNNYVNYYYFPIEDTISSSICLALLISSAFNVSRYILNSVSPVAFPFSVFATTAEKRRAFFITSNFIWG